jgi:hypothetical protein
MLNLPAKILILIVFICAKEILVFNEEILIVIAFSIFIYFISTYASSMIVNELDEKANLIQNKFDVYKNIQEKTIIHLLNYHTKRELLSERIKTIANIKKLRISVVHEYYKTNLNKQTVLQIEDILNRFLLNEYVNSSAFQERFVLKLDTLKQKLNAYEKKK